MITNLTRGKPYQSRLRSLLPEAVALRKSGASWAQIAAELGERSGVEIPLTTLYEAATKWIRRRAQLDALPDSTPPIRESSQADSAALSEAPKPTAKIASATREDFDDEPKGPAILGAAWRWCHGACPVR